MCVYIHVLLTSMPRRFLQPMVNNLHRKTETVSLKKSTFILIVYQSCLSPRTRDHMAPEPALSPQLGHPLSFSSALPTIADAGPPSPEADRPPGLLAQPLTNSQALPTNRPCLLKALPHAPPRYLMSTICSRRSCRCWRTCFSKPHSAMAEGFATNQPGVQEEQARTLMTLALPMRCSATIESPRLQNPRSCHCTANAQSAYHPSIDERLEHRARSPSWTTSIWECLLAALKNSNCFCRIGGQSGSVALPWSTRWRRGGSRRWCRSQWRGQSPPPAAAAAPASPGTAGPAPPLLGYSTSVGSTVNLRRCTANGGFCMQTGKLSSRSC